MLKFATKFLASPPLHISLKQRIGITKKKSVSVGFESKTLIAHTCLPLARSVLSENYGSIHVIFGEPIFSKEALTQFGVDRTIYNLQPRTNDPLSPPEMKACSRLGEIMGNLRRECACFDATSYPSFIFVTIDTGILRRESLQVLPRLAPGFAALWDPSTRELLGLKGYGCE